MPKLPRGAGKATTKERAKKPATKRAATSKAAPAKKANGAAAAKTTSARKKPAAPRANGGATATKPKTRTPVRRKTVKAPELDFRHRPVDIHEGHAPAGPATKLTDDQRRLLGDLFAV